MTIFTNFGPSAVSLSDPLDQLLPNAQSVDIACGYISQEALRNYGSKLVRVGENGGSATLLIGMARFEGLHRNTYQTLLDLNAKLQASSHKSEVRVVWSPAPYHGKLFRIRTSSEVHYFAGSANFSASGFKNNIEFSISIDDPAVKAVSDKFLDWLLDDNQSINISKVNEFPLIENAVRTIVTTTPLTSVPVPSAHTPYVDISLSRIDRQRGSSLNAFFGRGRIQRRTGIITPRDWFEVEIISDNITTSNPIYPKGDFVAITDDGYRIECSTQGDYFKNLRSKHDLKILGKWIKGKLQDTGALVPYQPVTTATLANYGRDFIRLYRISEGVYRMDF